MVTHVYLGLSRDRSWCGRYVGFHQHLPAITEERALERLPRSGTAGLCRSCVRSIGARGPGELGRAVEEARARARQAALEHLQRRERVR